MSYLNGLNTKQLQAVTCDKKYIRVVAGAGSGKTKVLTSRISYLVDSGVNPLNILAITFTNKASKEMKERVLRNNENMFGSPFISTFHSFCVRFLREEIGVLGYPRDFNIIDDYIISTNEISNDVTVLNLENGKPVLTDERLAIGSPLCVVI